MQCLVLASFALQVFLLFSGGVRKRNTSGAVRLLLWLAYLLADTLAVFVLGHLALHATAGARHQLVLFWAPFLLLHLGGQETISAFSTEDNALWKRHLLSLASQVSLAVYTAGKAWRGGGGGGSDWFLAASMALVFAAGTIKYAERIYALKCADAMALRRELTTPLLLNDPILPDDSSVLLLSAFFKWMETGTDRAQSYPRLVREAYHFFGLYMSLLMDVPRSWLSDDYSPMAGACRKLQSQPDRLSRSYKLAEIQLSLVYDYLYTKIGMRHCHMNPLVGAALQAVTFVSTSGAAALFAAAERRHGDGGGYSNADVAVSYVLLVGAVFLEVSSAVMLASSYWTYCGVDDFAGDGEAGIGRFCADVIFRVVKFFHPASRRLWSGKLASYDLVGASIQEKQAGVVGRAIRWIGVDCETTHVDLTDEVKALVLGKLIGAGVNWAEQKDFAKFRGQQALEKRGRVAADAGAARPTTVLHDSVSSVDFPTSVLIWHVATDICFFFFSGDGDHNEDPAPAPPHRRASKELSDYLMYLVAKCDVVRSSSSRFMIDKAVDGIKKNLAAGEGGHLSRRRHAREMVEGDKYDDDKLMLFTARAVGRYLLGIEDAAERWELVAAVWVEMLCYLAPRCGAEFHKKHLSTGGEFVTHVRGLMINLGLAWDLRQGW